MKTKNQCLLSKLTTAMSELEITELTKDTRISLLPRDLQLELEKIRLLNTESAETFRTVISYSSHFGLESGNPSDAFKVRLEIHKDQVNQEVVINPMAISPNRIQTYDDAYTCYKSYWEQFHEFITDIISSKPGHILTNKESNSGKKYYLRSDGRSHIEFIRESETLAKYRISGMMYKRLLGAAYEIRRHCITLLSLGYMDKHMSAPFGAAISGGYEVECIRNSIRLRYPGKEPIKLLNTSLVDKTDLMNFIILSLHDRKAKLSVGEGAELNFDGETKMTLERAGEKFEFEASVDLLDQLIMLL